MTTYKISIKYLLILLIIFGLGLFLRLHNLSLIPVFADEAIYIRWSQIMRAEESLRFLPLSDGKQPLFMWLTIPFLKFINDPLIAGRIVSVLSGIGNIIGLGIMSYLLFKSKTVSVVTALIYAVLPFAVFFDRLALADSLLSFFGLWTIIFSVLTVQYKRLDTAMFAGFFLGGALITKSPGIYFVLLLPLTLILSKWSKKLKEILKNVSTYVFLFSFTFGIGLVIQNILRLGPNFHMISLRNSDYVYPFSHILTSPFDPLKPFLIRNFEYLWIMGTPIFIILIVVGIIYGFKNFKKETIFLATLALVPIFISSEFSKTMTARYIYFSIPYFVVLTSITFSNIEENKSRLRTFLLSLFVAMALLSSYKFVSDPQKSSLPRSERSGYLEEWTSGYGIKEVSEYIRSEYEKNPSRKIVIGTEGYFGTLPDGLQIYLSDLPEVTVVGVGQPLRSMPDSLSSSKSFGNKTYLVINDTRLLVDYDSLDLELIRKYPKAIKPDGSTEHLLFLEVVEK